jgi:16S rRNA (cytidine1402-2'-O)-methyltransferase
MPGTLYLVATPIGNLQDITLRAIETLRNVDVIACEETRRTRNLLTHLRISNRLISYHEHNEYERAEELADRLLLGDSVAIVSDAGTPGISDPGHRLVQRAAEIGAAVVAIPGPVAFVAAVISSGLPTASVYFGGFLPSKKGDRQRRLTEIKDTAATLVFYEAPHRLARSLADCAEILGPRRAAVARELTKIHEEIVRADLNELAERYLRSSVKGEIVIVIERAAAQHFNKEDASRKILLDRIHALQKEGLDRKAALKAAAKEFGMSKSEVYKLTQIRDDREPGPNAKKKRSS